MSTTNENGDGKRRPRNGELSMSSTRVKIETDTFETLFGEPPLIAGESKEAYLIAILGEILRVAGIFDYNIIFHNPLMSRLGIIDNVLQVVITINSLFLILFGIPALVVERDLKRCIAFVCRRATE
jgi:hypothetical protein